MWIPTRWTRRFAFGALSVALLLPASAFADDWQSRLKNSFSSGYGHLKDAFSIDGPVGDAFSIGFDVVILRPLGLATLAVGTVAFVPVAIITSPNGLDGIRAAQQLLINEPAKNVFQRPLREVREPIIIERPEAGVPQQPPRNY